MTTIADETLPWPTEGTLQFLLRRYERLSRAEARTEHQIRRHAVVIERTETVEAMDLVAKSETNPLTTKPHSWTSAKEHVKHTTDAIAREDALLELRYRVDLLKIERRLAWATLEALIRAAGLPHD
jgi:hypothetical protein